MRIFFIVTILLLMIAGCSDDIGLTQNANQIHPADVSVSQASLEEEPIVVGPGHSLWDEIQSNNTIVLEEAIYEFDSPIIISNLTNFTITAPAGKATLRFKFDGPAIIVKDASDYIKIENIILDNVPTCQGCNAYYFSAADVGRIDIRNSSHVTVSKCELGMLNMGTPTGDENGQVYISRSSFCKVDSCIVHPAKGEMITLEGCDNSVISNDTVYGGGDGDDQVHANSGIETKGHMFSGSYTGYNNVISSNHVYDCFAAFITINDRQTIVENNHVELTLSGTGCGPGIRFGHTDSTWLRAVNCIGRNNTVRNINGTDLAPDDAFEPTGIVVHATRHDFENGGGGINTLHDNIIENCTGGIRVSNQEAQTVYIRRNTITAIDFGVDVHGAATGPQVVTLDSNYVRSQGTIATVRYNHATGTTSNTGAILNNRVFGGTIGISLENSDGVNVLSNYIRESTDYCIKTSSCSSMAINNNSGTINYSAVIYLLNTNTVELNDNWLWLLSGNSLYAIYSDGSTDLTFSNNTHNYPHYSNYDEE